MLMIIGVTGGVGTGKSTVLKFLKESYDAFLIMADEIGKDITMPGFSAYDKVIELFGTKILSNGPRSEINRKALSDIVFNEPKLLETLNSVIHPLVMKEVKRLLNVSDKPLKVIESAILVEAGYLDLIDELWVVHTDLDVRIKRLKESRGYSTEKIRSIMDNQMGESEIEAMADFVIDNSFSEAHTEEQIRNYLSAHA